MYASQTVHWLEHCAENLQAVGSSLTTTCIYGMFLWGVASLPYIPGGTSAEAE